MGLTQAAISQRVQALEKMLDASLFLRQGGRILLTEAGQQLYSYAQKIFELHRSARQAITGRKLPISGELFLGASTIPGEYFLPAILSIFHKRFPHIDVRAGVSDSMDVIRQVERGDIQLGLVGRKTESPHLEFRLFAHDRMALVVPSKHPWSERKKVSLKQLCQQPIILREAGSGLRHCFEKELSRLGKSVRDLQIALELGSNEAIKKAVLRKVGIAILSTFATNLVSM